MNLFVIFYGNFGDCRLSLLPNESFIAAIGASEQGYTIIYSIGNSYRFRGHFNQHEYDWCRMRTIAPNSTRGALLAEKGFNQMNNAPRLPTFGSVYCTYADCDVVWIARFQRPPKLNLCVSAVLIAVFDNNVLRVILDRSGAFAAHSVAILFQITDSMTLFVRFAYTFSPFHASTENRPSFVG